MPDVYIRPRPASSRRAPRAKSRHRRLGRLEVDDELEPARPLDRQIAGLGALQDLGGVGHRRTPEHRRNVRTVGHQRATLGEQLKRLIIGIRLFSAGLVISARWPRSSPIHILSTYPPLSTALKLRAVMRPRKCDWGKRRSANPPRLIRTKIPDFRVSGAPRRAVTSL